MSLLAGLITGLFTLAVLPTTTQAAEPTPTTSEAATPTEQPPVTSTPSATPPSRPPGELTITLARNCTAYSVDATIVNRTGPAIAVAAYRLPRPVGSDADDVLGPLIDTTTVAAGRTGLLRVPATFMDPLDIAYVRQDADAIVTRFDAAYWLCPRRYDFHARVVSGSSYTSPALPPGGAGDFRTRHGKIHTLDIPTAGWQFRYTPDPGYVGLDRLDYYSVPSAEQFGTFFFTIVPRPPRATTPNPARTANPGNRPAGAAAKLPATGPTGLPWLLATAAGLLLSGGLLLTLHRSRGDATAGRELRTDSQRPGPGKRAGPP